MNYPQGIFVVYKWSAHVGNARNTALYLNTNSLCNLTSYCIINKYNPLHPIPLYQNQPPFQLNIISNIAG